jgi:hypothetical protein
VEVPVVVPMRPFASSATSLTSDKDSSQTKHWKTLWMAKIMYHSIGFAGTSYYKRDWGSQSCDKENFHQNKAIDHFILVRNCYRFGSVGQLYNYLDLYNNLMIPP